MPRLAFGFAAVVIVLAAAVGINQRDWSAAVTQAHSTLQDFAAAISAGSTPAPRYVTIAHRDVTVRAVARDASAIRDFPMPDGPKTVTK